MKDISEMTKEEFLALPKRRLDTTSYYSQLVFFPNETEELHESGYRLIVVCGAFEDKRELITTHSDHVWLTDILVGKRADINMDCLPDGCFRIFTHGFWFKVGLACSTLQISIEGFDYLYKE
jgi:hypothetical protein